MHTSFLYDRYLLRRQVLALTGKFRIYSPAGQLVLFSEQGMFRLKEDIRVYADDSKTQELLWIQARQILDFSAAYDVTDTTTGVRVGSLRRKGLRSMVRDTWEIWDPGEAPLGVIEEDTLALGLLRRFVLGSLLPQNYDARLGGERVADFRQRFNLFRYELDIDFTPDVSRRLDRRLGLAAAILLGTIEGKQQS